jgi:hypothetical protein
MNQGEQTSTHHGKYSHGFSCSVYTGTPFLTKDEKNRRNQSACVTDTDPPNEIGNIPTPIDRTVEIPSTYTIPYRP